MQFVKVNGATLRVWEAGDPKGPVVVFVHGPGTDLTVWDDVVARLPAGYRCIGYDLHGHGLSSLPRRDMSLEDHAAELLALTDRLTVREFALCGLSVGGMIALRAAAEAPNRVRALALCATGAACSEEVWSDRMAAVRANSLGSLSDAAMQHWFTPTFRAEHPVVVEGYRAGFVRTPVEGHIATCSAVRDVDLTETARRVVVPTLCLAGAEDGEVPPARVSALADVIEGALYLEIGACGHLLPVERPGACAEAIASLLARLDEAPAADRGAAVRRQVLGAAHVDRASAAATPLDRAFQQFITEGAWGRVWSGRHFTLRERSIVTLALLAAAGQDDEVAMHLRATANTGASPADVAEAMMHVAVYAGVPKANRALKIAREVLASRMAQRPED